MFKKLREVWYVAHVQWNHSPPCYPLMDAYLGSVVAIINRTGEAIWEEGLKWVTCWLAYLLEGVAPSHMSKRTEDVCVCVCVRGGGCLLISVDQLITLFSAVSWPPSPPSVTFVLPCVGSEVQLWAPEGPIKAVGPFASASLSSSSTLR